MDSINPNTGNISFCKIWKVEAPGQNDVGRVINELSQILKLKDKDPDSLISRQIRETIAAENCDYFIPKTSKCSFCLPDISSCKTSNGDSFMAIGKEAGDFDSIGFREYKRNPNVHNTGVSSQYDREVYDIMSKPESRIPGNKKLVIEVDTWPDGLFKSIKKVFFKTDETDYTKIN